MKQTASTSILSSPIIKTIDIPIQFDDFYIFSNCTLLVHLINQSIKWVMKNNNQTLFQLVFYKYNN